MIAHSGMTLNKEEMEFVYAALSHFEDGLRQYQTWIKNKNGFPLPGMETASKEVYIETAKVIDLNLKIYNTCFDPNAVKNK